RCRASSAPCYRPSAEQRKRTASPRPPPVDIFRLVAILGWGVFRLGLLRRLRLLLAFDALVDLFAVYRDALRRIDANANLISLDPQNRNSDFVADHYGFANPARKNEHLQIPLDLSNFRYATATQARLEARSVHAVIHVRVRENFNKENPTVPTVASA